MATAGTLTDPLAPSAPRRPRTVTEPAREIPVHAVTEVLVVGGGPAGTAAALAARRAGADVLLVERANHLGGLSTGGLVIWIDRMTDWHGRLVIAGIGSELLQRLPEGAVAGPPDRSGARPRPITSAIGGSARAHFATRSPGRR
jgi:NADPH-dependent 2,4-dienoyl-CoA reductase/sulfur reductase-like enzyme